MTREETLVAALKELLAAEIERDRTEKIYGEARRAWGAADAALNIALGEERESREKFQALLTGSTEI